MTLKSFTKPRFIYYHFLRLSRDTVRFLSVSLNVFSHIYMSVSSCKCQKAIKLIKYTYKIEKLSYQKSSFADLN